MRCRRDWYVLRTSTSHVTSRNAGKVIEYPFDTVKVRLQLSSYQEPTSRLFLCCFAHALNFPVSESKGALQTFKQVLRNEGVSGIYRGMSSPLIGCVFETSCLFVAHGQIKVMVGADDTSRFRLDRILLASGLTGLMVSFVLTPIELIKCRMQSYPPKYHGPVDCVRRSVAAEGWRVLYKGHQATMLREFFGTACWFGTYEVFLHVSVTFIRRFALNLCCLLPASIKTHTSGLFKAGTSLSVPPLPNKHLHCLVCAPQNPRLT